MWHKSAPPLTTPIAQAPSLGYRKMTLCQVLSLTIGDFDASPNVVTGIISLFSHRALVLFDSGDTYSFISHKYACLSERHLSP